MGEASNVAQKLPGSAAVAAVPFAPPPTPPAPLARSHGADMQLMLSNSVALGVNTRGAGAVDGGGPGGGGVRSLHAFDAAASVAQKLPTAAPPRADGGDEVASTPAPSVDGPAGAREEVDEAGAASPKTLVRSEKSAVQKLPAPDAAAETRGGLAAGAGGVAAPGATPKEEKLAAR